MESTTQNKYKFLKIFTIVYKIYIKLNLQYVIYKNHFIQLQKKGIYKKNIWKLKHGKTSDFYWSLQSIVTKSQLSLNLTRLNQYM